MPETGQPKILLLDDDADLLQVYKQTLESVPNAPVVYTATTGPQALKLLENDTFRVFICDLMLPRMDGLQVLSIVRRRFPQLRTVVLTSVLDEEIRSRVYALGVDLFWQKPSNDEEVRMFLECIQSLLDQPADTGGFRGVQSKSLVDIIQLECLTQTTGILKVTHGALEGRIWFQQGEIIDAETEGLSGEAAFKRILSWKEGAFEILPVDEPHERRIMKPFNALLLEAAQEMDESAAAVEARDAGGALTRAVEEARSKANRLLELMGEFNGVEFVLVQRGSGPNAIESCGLETPQRVGEWLQQVVSEFQALGLQFQAGPLRIIVGLGPRRNVGVVPTAHGSFCVGWHFNVPLDTVMEQTRKIMARWES